MAPPVRALERFFVMAPFLGLFSAWYQDCLEHPLQSRWRQPWLHSLSLCTTIQMAVCPLEGHLIWATEEYYIRLPGAVI
jgi:hypothetical protein